LPRDDADAERAQEGLQRSLARVHEYRAAFSEQAREIVHSLQEHKDLDLRCAPRSAPADVTADCLRGSFLSIRLSFNSEFYKTRKEFLQQQQRPQSA
jgi:hypothetical protein